MILIHEQEITPKAFQHDVYLYEAREPGYNLYLDVIAYQPVLPIRQQLVMDDEQTLHFRIIDAEDIIYASTKRTF
jgi:hypothetical protein